MSATRSSSGSGRRPRAAASGDLRVFARYVRRLPGFLRTTVTPEEARRRIEQELQRREESFLGVLERGVYARERSPYRELLAAAGVELGDVRSMIGELGLEPTLERLHDAGVYVTLDEFKGRRPVERDGVSLPIDQRAFENPLVTTHYRAAGGGSRSAPRRVSVDLQALEQEAAYHSLFRTTFELWGRPFAVYRVIPPNASGVNNCLRQVKVGGTVARWFNPYRAPRTIEALKFSVFTRYTVLAGRLWGSGLARPRYCPPHEAHGVASWLAEMTRRGSPGVVDTQASLGVRVCLAAQEHGLDISGTFFRFGGEPYTEAKAQVVAESGARAACHYTMGETGRLGVACGDPVALDDVHVLSDRLAVLQRDRRVDSSDRTVGALYHTTLTPSTPKLMINAESDDYGVLEKRSCGCPLGELGLSLHLHRIRSFEKLTSEGNHFLGSDLIALVDEVLPARFGGSPTDYQLVEEEERGLPKVNIVIRPQVGDVAEDEVVSSVVAFLRSEPRNRLMAEVWQQSDTLRVVRREPSRTVAGKLLPLHIARDD
jgi:hypothetical protein